MTTVILKSNYRDARNLFDTLKQFFKHHDFATFFMIEIPKGRIHIIWDINTLEGLFYDFVVPDSDLPLEHLKLLEERILSKLCDS